MAVDDLAALPASPLVAAEGSVLPASAVSGGVAVFSQAVWLMPTPEFQHAQLRARDTPLGPARLYAALAERIEAEAAEAGVRVVTVDGSRDVAQIVAEVEEIVKDALARGPRAETAGERQALRREANEAIAAQVRGYYARAWADGDADAVVRSFICECGDAACHEFVPIPVGALRNQHPRASGHQARDFPDRALMAQ
jgi:hypothetical protein